MCIRDSLRSTYGPRQGHPRATTQLLRNHRREAQGDVVQGSEAFGIGTPAHEGPALRLALD
eukprot:10912633-Alexandrium_andersonii.AAC.1